MTTPSQHAADNPAVERNASRLKQWIAELPVMDVVATVRQLHAAISPFNEVDMPDAERLKLLEIYRQSFEEILFTYDDCRLRVLPLAAAERDDLAEDIMWLYLELAAGYKILVRNGHQEGLEPARDALLLQAIYRAMELIAHGLLYALRAGKAPPPLVRLELHQLYAFAEFGGALDQRVRALRRETAVPTIDRLYKQCLLMDLLDLERLSGLELMEVFVLLEDHASHCLIDAAAAEPVAGQFVIDLMADEAPQPVGKGRPLMPRRLDVRPVRDVLETWLGEQGKDPSGFMEQDLRLMRVLVGLLGSNWGRQHPRNPVRRFVKVALGLEALTYFLEDAGRIEQACNAEVHGGIEVLSLDSEEETRHLLGDWQMLDQSETGCLLVGRPAADAAFPAQGSLLGVVGFAADQPRRLSLGIVRWQGEISEGRIKLGVEMLEGAAQPVLVADNAEDLAQAPAHGFYFPRDAAADRPAALLLPRQRDGHPLHVRVQGRAFVVDVVAVLREAEDFVQYRFRVQE